MGHVLYTVPASGTAAIISVTQGFPYCTWTAIVNAVGFFDHNQRRRSLMAHRMSVADERSPAHSPVS
ncbi:hypothetical protein L227DRAFT_580839 [Lentinus tigrinus ALCF2SS1-6]|uniref:Uncharacterized protein n=1 Tax=Lentinus tigrinus ALCF2SS1-6 TaxID=1328759 RepID=A0A5C2RQX0_9APHY|nr:hypothetical protein L227DRAFT_580839 [Lentinus tigrinus ALCF2SS1-6]